MRLKDPLYGGPVKAALCCVNDLTVCMILAL